MIYSKQTNFTKIKNIAIPMKTKHQSVSLRVTMLRQQVLET